MEIIFLKLIVNSNKQPNGCFFYKLKDIIREDTKEEIEMIISTLSSYPNKKVVKDLGIVVGYDDAIRAFRVTMGVGLWEDRKPYKRNYSHMKSEN